MKFNLYHASIAAIAVITSLTSFTNLVKAQEYQNLVPLELYWSPQREDNFVTATPDGKRSAGEAGYSYARTEACVFRKQKPGTVPLNLYWSAQRGDNFTTATSEGAASAKEAGYIFARVEGYVFPASQCQ
ncbi:hypothetical protein ACSQ6I_27110 [Anabaena sp. WFMT]|uniref:hypothetical protein n=1 Tax=Anabaena sp. WFMT TaxID=3449730 RepID=UPI003F282CBB